LIIQQSNRAYRKTAAVAGLQDQKLEEKGKYYSVLNESPESQSSNKNLGEYIFAYFSGKRHYYLQSSGAKTRLLIKTSRC
jgi:hypothetical protein